ncbi:MAG TPA: protein-disulfide reductase DsbD domain-containing protein [Vicinamibacterales bacterium]
MGGAVAPSAPADVAGGQLTATLGVSDAKVAPGGRVTLIVDLKPKPKMHVYAPGQPGYIPLTITLDSSPDIKAQLPKFPAPGTYFFAPLKETVKVYMKPIRLTQEVTLGLSQDMRRRAAANETLVITGSLSYQACDDRVCYRPETLPLSWSVTLAPFIR